jgi:hypothetical protein
MKYLLALGAGFMLSVTFFEIIPKTILILAEPLSASREDLYLPMLLLMAGYLLTQFFEHTIAPHFHLGEEVHSENLISRSSAYTAVGGLMIQYHFLTACPSPPLPDRCESRLSLVFIAVFLHKFPEGFTIGSMILAAGKGFREVIWSTVLLGGTTLLGVLDLLCDRHEFELYCCIRASACERRDTLRCPRAILFRR